MRPRLHLWFCCSDRGSALQVAFWCSLHVLSVFVRVLSGCSDFLSQSKLTQAKSSGDCIFPTGVSRQGTPLPVTQCMLGWAPRNATPVCRLASETWGGGDFCFVDSWTSKFGTKNNSHLTESNKHDTTWSNNRNLKAWKIQPGIHRI